MYPSVTNLGVRPTIGDGKFVVETHILPPEGLQMPAVIADLYGIQVRVAFVQRMRDELTFDSLDALTVQMREDCRQAAHVFRQISL